MESEKIDQALQLALQIPEEERAESSFLEYGFEKETGTWQLIVKHTGSIKNLESDYPNTQIVELFSGYSIITTGQENIDALTMRPEIIYIEKPRQLYFNVQDGRNASCLSGVQKDSYSTIVDPLYGYQLSGAGVLIGIIDSGIDYKHPAFISPDGESRIAYFWNQTASGEETIGRIPAGYDFGAQYSKEAITNAISNDIPIPNTETVSGHGTAVAGIAAGNGSGSLGNRYKGIAAESELIVVRLDRKREEFSGTTEVMLGIDYAIRKAISLNRPIAINLSFGTNDGAHDGRSLFENYISELNGIWKNVIVAATGNEGDSRHHSQILLSTTEKQAEFSVAPGERSLSLQLWKEYIDDFSIILQSPAGRKIYLADRNDIPYRYQTAYNEILYYYSSPTPFTPRQAVFIEWISGNSDFIEPGIWTLEFIPKTILSGRVDLWLPTLEAVGSSTGFLTSEPDTTLTIPSTARNIISVGAYQTDTGIIAPFSGRGNTADNRNMPALVAPGVNIMTTLPESRYGRQTGTSMAAPFVTGSAALLMEWGIVRGNDPYLYGEKIKAYLTKGARPLPGQTRIPDKTAGYGALCVRDSFPKS